MIALVGCVKLKTNHRAPAEQLYISPLFKKTIRFIKSQKYDDWFILSAKYGLIEKDKIIDPYELTLNNFSKLNLKKWSEIIFEEIKEKKLNHLSFFCGSKYHNEFLLNLLRQDKIDFNLPLFGLTLGQRLSFFNNVNFNNKGFFS